MFTPGQSGFEEAATAAARDLQHRDAVVPVSDLVRPDGWLQRLWHRITHRSTTAPDAGRH